LSGFMEVSVKISLILLFNLYLLIRSTGNISINMVNC
jgi:hypothetical protein